MSEFDHAWEDEWVRWFHAGRGGKSGMALDQLVVGGHGAGKMAAVELKLREHIERHGTKSVLLCGASPGIAAMRQRLGLPEPPPADGLRSIFDVYGRADMWWWDV